MKRYESHSPQETENIAAEWLAGMSAKHPAGAGALVVGLSGQLGAGKTAFTKAVAKALGVIETVTSPTFVIMKAYKTADHRWTRLIHIDAYRLERPEELEVLKLKDLITDAGNLIMIEWPEHAGLTEFAEGANLQLEVSGEGRAITVK